MNISEMTDEQLKALGYDQVKLLQATQSNLALIEQELARRMQPTEEKGE